jgi:ABC-type Fe3+-hydroxamate transport system substrate-binding protein
MEFFDQLGRTIVMNGPPNKIVCLVPSITEFLVAVGLQENIVGITKFCVHPPHLKKLTECIGGTKNVNIEKIKLLKPDLIIANKEENTKEDILNLASCFPVWMTDVTNFHSAIAMMKGLSQVLDCVSKCKELIDEISREFASLITIGNQKKISVLYLIWKKPYMSIGSDTYIHSMLQIAGFDSVTKHLTRYPIIKEIQIPDFIFLSSEPYPFTEKDIDEVQKNYPKSKILLVDGEMFSWYGKRMHLFPSYIRQLILS